MSRREILILTGNYAIAYAVKQARVEVIAAYPITPQTTIVEKLDEFIENGELDAKMIRVESEHSAMGAAIGASAAGARTFTATSSHGLLYMYENIWWASNCRLPIVAAYVTRTIGPPWNIWTDHQDFMTLRDTGWILFFARNAQEAYDLIIQAFKIAEDPSIRLPVGVTIDAFVTSHTAEPVEVLGQDDIDKFLPDPRNIKPLIDVDEPYSIGNLPTAEDHYILRKDVWNALHNSINVITRVGEEYTRLSGRDYSRPIECYKCEDAEAVFISMGAMAGDGMDAVDILRERGEKVGHISLRLFRPYPSEYILNAIENAKKVITFSRAYTPSRGGILAEEILSLLYRVGRHDIEVYDILAGLAGVEVSIEDYIKVYNDVKMGILKPFKPIFIRGGEYV